MAEPGAAGDAAPRTGDAEIDAALQSLTGLDEAPLAEHHDRLAGVHEVLQGALDRGDTPGRP